MREFARWLVAVLRHEPPPWSVQRLVALDADEESLLRDTWRRIEAVRMEVGALERRRTRRAGS